MKEEVCITPMGRPCLSLLRDLLKYNYCIAGGLCINIPNENNKADVLLTYQH